MLYVHENNFKTKIKKNYKNKRNEIEKFYNTYYLQLRNEIESIVLSEYNISSFKKATDLFNDYYNELINFSNLNNISSQSKFTSTFLEEISVYLFKNIPDISSNTLGVFNKGIYAGLKINNNKNIEIIKKDVDFCIGKKVNITIDNQSSKTLIIPIVAVEVKTYLDATMFGEVKSSSRAIKNASPNSKTYLLVGYKDLANEHIISARQDSALNEIFVLRYNKNAPIDSDTLYEYWKEINNSIKELSNENSFVVPGRLLKP